MRGEDRGPAGSVNALFAAAGPKVQVVAYRSGKCVVQGKGTEEFVQFVLELK